MAWPTQTTTLNDALASVDRAAAEIKAKCASLRLQSVAGDITAYQITQDLLPKLKAARTVFLAAAELPGIAAFVAAQSGISEQSVVGAFNAMLTAVDGCLTWIEANLPKEGGYLVIEQITADGSGVITPRLFSSAATAGLRTPLQAVESAIA